MSKGIQIFEYENLKITFEFENGQRMVNANKMAKIFDKRVANFTRLQSTKDFIEVLEESLNADSRKGNEYKAYRVVKGGTPQLTGTWMEERLALKFAAWLNPRFELWVYSILHEVLSSDHRNLKFHIEKITNSVEEARIWLDTIPLQEPSRNRLELAKRLDAKKKKLD
jgi:hypothetical protein